MAEPTQELHKVFLYPANVHVAVQPTCITTLLGTCVAVCLWDPITKIGGMNHYLLSLWNGDGLASPKYGNIAIEKLVMMMESRGASKKRIVAKIFGGKASLNGNTIAYNIGMRNIQVAKDLLKEMNIPIEAESVGGEHGRNIKFDTTTGKIMMRYITGAK